MYCNTDFSQKLILCFYTAMALDKKLKLNVCKTYVRLINVLSPVGCERASKFVIKQTLLNNKVLKVSNKCTKKRCEISPSLNH